MKSITFYLLILINVSFLYGQELSTETKNLVTVKYKAAKLKYENGSYDEALSKISEANILMNHRSIPRLKNLKIKILIAKGEFQKAQKELKAMYKFKKIPSDVSTDMASYESKIEGGIKEEKRRIEQQKLENERQRLAEIERKKKQDAKQKTLNEAYKHFYYGSCSYSSCNYGKVSETKKRTCSYCNGKKYVDVRGSRDIILGNPPVMGKCPSCKAKGYTTYKKTKKCPKCDGTDKELKYNGNNLSRSEISNYIHKYKRTIDAAIETKSYFRKNRNVNLVASYKNNKYGFIDKNLDLVIPHQYQDARVSIENNRGIVKKDGNWGVIDKENNVVVPFLFDEIYKEDNGSFTATKNGVTTIIDYDGNQSEVQYEKVEILPNNAKYVKVKGEKFSKLIIGDKDFIGVNYVKADPRGNFIYRIADDYGLLKYNGETKLRHVFSKIKYKSGLKSYLCSFGNPKAYLIYDDVKNIKSQWYDKLYTTNTETIITKKDGLYGFHSAKKTISPKYKDLTSMDGDAMRNLYIVRSSENNLDGVINSNGEVVIPLKYYLIQYNEDGYFYCREKEKPTKKRLKFNKNGEYLGKTKMAEKS